jgi:dolichyl-phosphate-mannose--protein O-mannosyl transferase
MALLASLLPAASIVVCVCLSLQPAAPSVSFAYLFPTLNQEMLAASARITTVHPWATRFWEWVVNKQGVLYWRDQSKVTNEYECGCVGP